MPIFGVSRESKRNNTNGTTYAFDSKRNGWGSPVHQLFVQNHVTAFYHGHDHVYAKAVLDGVVYHEVPMPANAHHDTGFSTNSSTYAGPSLVANSGHLLVTVAPTTATVDYVRSYLSGDGQNGTVATSCTMQGYQSQ